MFKLDLKQAGAELGQAQQQLTKVDQNIRSDWFLDWFVMSITNFSKDDSTYIDLDQLHFVCINQFMFLDGVRFN